MRGGQEKADGDQGRFDWEHEGARSDAQDAGSDSVIVVANTGGIAATNSYLVADEASSEAVIFDAPNDTVGPLVEEAKRRGLKVIGLWLTHGHVDHIADHAEVISAFPEAQVLIHRLDEPKLRRPNAMAMFLPFKIPPRGADAYVE